MPRKRPYKSPVLRCGTRMAFTQPKRALAKWL